MSHGFEQPQSGSADERDIEQYIEGIIHEVEAILNEQQFQSRAERDLYLSKLDAALAMSNHPKVLELIHDIRERYPD